MIKEDVKEYFKVEKEADKPLYTQLKERFEQFITKHKIGDKLPSERLIATTLLINRETVRTALKEFVDNGIVRRTNGGTVIARKNEEPVNEEHPLIYMNFSEYIPVKNLRLSLYENLPQQKQFWTKTVQLFNQQSTKVQVEIEWVPLTVSTQGKHLEYIKLTNPDLYLLSNNNISIYNKEGLLAPLPDFIKNTLSSEFYWNEFAAKQKDLLDFAVPIHFSPWLTVWNNDLAEKIGLKNIKSKINHHGIDNFLLNISKDLPANILMTGSVWNFLVSLGIPGHNQSLEKEFFSDRFRRLLPFRENFSKVFITRQTHTYEAIELFFKKKILLYTGGLFFILKYLKTSDISIDGDWTIPDNGYVLSNGMSCVGANSRGLFKDELWEFMKFLTTEQSQKLLISEFVNGSYLKGPNRDWRNVFPSCNFNRLSDSVKCFEVDGSKVNSIGNLMMFKIRDLYINVLSGHCTPEKAAEEALKRYQCD